MDYKELEVTAALAQLELNPADKEKFGQAVSQMLEYFAQMSGLDVDDLAPTTHVLIKKNRIREDVTGAASLNNSDALLENSAELEDRFIVIPNVL